MNMKNYEIKTEWPLKPSSSHRKGFIYKTLNSLTTSYYKLRHINELHSWTFNKHY